MALFDLGFNTKEEKMHKDLKRILYAEQHGVHTSYTGVKALRNSDVFTAIKSIAEDVASTEIVTKNSETDDISKHILQLLNDRPDPDITGWHFKFIIIANLLINGNAYVEIIRDEKRLPIGLYFLHNDLVSMEEKDNEVLYNVSEDIEGNNVSITSDDILHFRYMTLDGLHGYSPLYSLMNEVAISQGSKSFLKRFFENGGTTTNVLTLEDSQLSQDQRDEITDRFEESLAKNDSGIITLDSTMKFDRIQVPTEALNFLNSYKFSTQQVAKAFGLPVSKLAIEEVNTSTSQSNSEYLTSTLYPLFSMIFAELKHKLFDEIDPTTSLTFDDSRFIDSDPEVKLKKYTELHRESIIQTNEARKAFGLPPIEGGDQVLIDINRMPSETFDEYQKAKIQSETASDNKGGDALGEQ